MESTLFALSDAERMVACDSLPAPSAGPAPSLGDDPHPRWRLDHRLAAVTQLIDAVPDAVALFVCTDRGRFHPPLLSRAAVNPLMSEWLGWVGAPLWGDLELAAHGVRVDGCSAKAIALSGLDVRVVTWSAPTGATRRPLLTARWGLTDRQADVLELVAEGHTNKSIARLLVISEATVELHVTRLLSKTGVENRATLVAAFWRVR